jgi:hypothetical protein
MSIKKTPLFVPGDIIFNPGPTYRMRAGETLLLLLTDDASLPRLLEERTWDSVQLQQPLGPAGRSRPGVPEGYGFPRRHDSDAWTWGHHAETHSRQWLEWFGDYDPRPHSAQPRARTARSGDATPANQKAREVWARLAHHVSHRVRELALKRALRSTIDIAHAKHADSKTRAMRRLREAGSHGGTVGGAFDGVDDARPAASGAARGADAEGGDQAAPRLHAIANTGAHLSPFFFAENFLLVRDVRTDCGEGGGPVGHVIVAAPGAHLLEHFLTTLRQDHMHGTSLSKMVVFLLSSFTNEQRARDAFAELRALQLCAIVVGEPTKADDLQRAGIAHASCLVLLDCEKSAADAIRDSFAAAGAHPGAQAAVKRKKAAERSPYPGQKPLAAAASGTNFAGGVLWAGGEGGAAGAPGEGCGFVASVDSFEDSSRIFSHVLVERALASIDTSPTLRLVISVATAACMPVLDAQRRRFHELGAAALSGRADAARQAAAQRAAAAGSRRDLAGDEDGDDGGDGGGGTGGVHGDLFSAPRVPDVLLEGVLGAAGTAALQPTQGEVEAVRAASDAAYNSPLAAGQYLPIFASGAVAVRSSAAAASVASYYSPTSVRIVEAMLAPDPDMGACLICEPLPRRFHNKTFGELAAELRSDPRYRAPLPIALYRPQKALAAPLDFLVLHPEPGTLLFSTPEGEDLVYFFALQPVWCGQHAAAPGEYDSFMESLYWTSKLITPRLERDMAERRDAVKADLSAAASPAPAASRAGRRAGDAGSGAAATSTGFGGKAGGSGGSVGVGDGGDRKSVV